MGEPGKAACELIKGSEKSCRKGSTPAEREALNTG